MSFLKDDKQEFRLSDLNIIGNPDSIFKTADFVNNKEPFGKIPLAVDTTVTNEYYTKLYDDITAPAAPERSSEAGLKQSVGYITMSKQELQEMLKPFTATVAYDEKSHTVISRGNVRFLHPNNNPQRAPITSYPVVDFKWKASDIKHDQKSITDTLTMSRKAGGKIIELVNNETLLDNYPLIIPTEAISKARDITSDRDLGEELVEEIQVVYLGFISFGVYYPEQPVVFKIKGRYCNGYFSDEIDRMTDGKYSHVPMPLLLAYNLPDGVYSYRSHADEINFMLFIGGMCQKNIVIFNDTYEHIDNYINGEITETTSTHLSRMHSNRHLRCVLYQSSNNDVIRYIEYDSDGQRHGVKFDLSLEVNFTSILTYKHGKLDGPFELRNQTQSRDFLVIGTFGNFQGPPPDIKSFTRDNIPTLDRYVVGKFFKSLNDSRSISVYHFNEKHQLNGIYELVTNIEGYSRQMIANRGEMYSSGDIIVLRQYYIENREVTKKEYTAYITKLREGIATIAKGKDVGSIIESYL